MPNSDDYPAGDAGRILRVPRDPTDSDSMMLRDFVRQAIHEGLVVPLAIAPDGVLILLPDASAGRDRSPPAGSEQQRIWAPGPARRYPSMGVRASFRFPDARFSSIPTYGAGSR